MADAPREADAAPDLAPPPIKTVVRADEFGRMLRRIAHEIVEAEPDVGRLVLLGIPTRGVPLASRLAELLAGITETPVTAGALDITLYRDDLAEQPHRAPGRTVIPGGTVDGKVVVLVDDVLYSGRTVRAALDAIADLGRPAAVRLAVAVDRGHRELPIRADFVGKNLPSAKSERVHVALAELDGEDSVTIRSEVR